MTLYTLCEGEGSTYVQASLGGCWRACEEGAPVERDGTFTKRWTHAGLKNGTVSRRDPETHGERKTQGKKKEIGEKERTQPGLNR